MVQTCISFINMKGGVGKTTAAFNLAWYACARSNQRVLVIDLDPQSNMSQYLMRARPYRDHIDNNRPTVVDIFEQFSAPTYMSGGPKAINGESVIHQVANFQNGSCIHLIPSRLELAWTLKNPTSKDHLIAKFISEHAHDYDLILIDCAPTESILTQAAYRASRYLVVPVKPEFLAGIGLPLLVRSLNEFRESFNHHTLELAGIFFTDADPQHKIPEHLSGRNDVKELAENQGWYIFDSELRHSDSYPRGAREGTPIFRTDYARDYVIDEFYELAAEFMRRIGK